MMTMPVHVTFRDLATNEALDALIRERAEALHTTYPRMLSCRVLVEVPHRHHRSGNRYHVRIELAVPGDTLVVSHHPGLDATVKQSSGVPTKAAELDADSRHGAVVIREAFDIARRRLNDFVERLKENPHVEKPPVRA
ncbi:MAG: HPF/RaiA family ribosome-associated protein [Vicinamibacterales bacterium]